MHIFFAQRSTKKVKGVTDAGLKPRKVRKVAVLGGGLMGSGIATAGLLAGQEVLIKEVNEKFMEVRIRQAPLSLKFLVVMHDTACIYEGVQQSRHSSCRSWYAAALLRKLTAVV